MDVDSEPPQSQFTILRIKRKRNEEPLDALVIESRLPRKRSRGIGVFQFAQTVEDDAWKDEKRAKDIQEQVSRIAREGPAAQESKPADPSTQGAHGLLGARTKEERHRYTILDRDESDVGERRTRRLPTHPPKVLAAKDLPPPGSTPEIKMFDAIREADKPSSPIDPEMAKFLPLLNDYLKINDVKLDPLPIKSDPKLDDDYVWDVFYHRPATLSEWNQAANVGTLSGLTASMINADDSGSEGEEEEDEADEDSNDEGYYKNDYPEDEEEESDEFHEDSDLDEVVHYDEGGGAHDWR